MQCIDKIIDTDKLENWTRIKEVKIDQQYSKENYKSANNSFYVGIKSYELPRISLNNILKNYEISDEEGLGLVIIYEGFSNPGKSISGYQVYFDIKSREIIQADYFNNEFSYSFNKVRHWGYAMQAAFEKNLRNYPLRADHLK